jgi:hypothetical protein
MDSLKKIHQLIDDQTPLEYRGKKTFLTKINEREGEVSISATVDGKPQTFIKESGEKLDVFLLTFKELPQEQENTESIAQQAPEGRHSLPARPYSVPQILQKHQSTFDKLSSLLLADIEKVRNDPGYVNQAKQVANTANAMINLAKLELDMSIKG